MSPRRLSHALTATAAFLGLAFGASPALAWGKTGHRAVAAMAERNLSGLARAHIREILGVESLDEAATWPDDMRASPDPFWKTATPWHYVTLQGQTYDEAPSGGDAITALQHFRATLLSPTASKKDKETALRFIVHLVADLHQPLHAGNGTDKGGNDVKVNWFGKPTNLHAVWDSALVDEEQLSFSELAERLARRTTERQVIEWWDANPLDWVRESAAIRDTVYPDKPDLSYDYIYRFTPVIDRRLQQAGVRLAAYLNDIYAGAPAAAPAMTRGPGRTRRHRM